MTAVSDAYMSSIQTHNNWKGETAVPIFIEEDRDSEGTLDRSTQLGVDNTAEA